MTETDQVVEAAEPSTRRGRPRPQESIARDEQVLNLIKSGPKTTTEIAEALRAAGIDNATAGLAYLSIYRIKRDAGAPELIKSKSEGKTVWSIQTV